MVRTRLFDTSALRVFVVLLAALALSAAWLWPGQVVAQAAPAAAAPAAPGTGAKKGPPAPEAISLTTSDNVQLSATYFAGANNKTTVPVILVHGYEGSQNDFHHLAAYLQKQGHAVLAVDLRGHGDSKKTKDGGTLDAKLLSAEQFRRMIRMDMEKFKAFLMEKHNAGELNIELLCVVGAEMGSIVALEWAGVDWAWPVLATGKQGQDARALVLISPEFSSKYLRLGPVLNFQPVMKNLSILILVGKGDSRASRDAQRLYNSFKKFHPDVPDEEKRDRQDLFFGRLDTSLQGAKLLGAKGLNVEKLVDDFIQLRLVSKAKDYPWKPR